MAILDTLYNNPVRIAIREFLQIELFPGFDLWMIVHFVSGLLIMFLLVKIFKDKDKNILLILTLLILAVWEFYELFNFMTTNRFFIPETIFNQITDLFIGGIGAFIYRLKIS